ncbi:hypothetical protein [Caenispirillum bisanense]|uniref:hypothetical protein n=1 Tax=Caenispirillum bisanense TaxID=414052 RepID=UPI0031DB8992
MTPDLARCNFLGLGRRAVEVTASAAIAFGAWLLLMPILGFAAMALQRLLTGEWPWPAKVMYLGLGRLLGLI